VAVLGNRYPFERVLMTVGMRFVTRECVQGLSSQGRCSMRRVFSFRHRATCDDFKPTNLDSKAGAASCVSDTAELSPQKAVVAWLRRRFQPVEGSRWISRKRDLLRCCLSLSLMAVAQSSTSALADVITLDGTSGSTQVSTAIDTSAGGKELQLGFYAQYLVIGGGGSGGTTYRALVGGSDGVGTGGGGGGGFVEGSGKQLSNQSYSITVGAGGIAPTSEGAGNNGGNSAFDNISALGGGGGGGEYSTAKAGGSGGGASGGDGPTTSGGAGTSGQGNAGGGNIASGSIQGSGGGGAGAAGTGIFGGTRGNGGVGRVSSITGASLLYGGGGGGGSYSPFSGGFPGFGGAGGGGNGNGIGNGANGTNGLGGGGGGVGYSGQGGRGGSGVVMVRYDGAQLVRPGSAAVGGTVTEGAGFTVHKFDTVGSTSFNMSDVDLNARLGAVVSSSITGTGDLSFSGPGQLTLNAANTHSGATRAVSGTLNLGHVDALQNSTLDMNSADSGTVNLTQSNQTYNVAGLQGTRDLALGNNTLSVGANNASTNYAGNLSGTGGLAKVGTGTLELSGANGFTGTTDVGAGKLVVNGSTAGGAVTVQNNASLGGSGTLGGSTTFQSGSTHTPGNSPGLQSFTSGLTYNTGSTFEWELIGNTTSGRGSIFDGVNVSGNSLSIFAGVTSSLIFNGASSAVDWTDSFWGSSRDWLVFSSTAGITSGPSIFDTINISNDKNGVSLSAARAGAFFSWSQSGNDLFLNYTNVPEPSSMVILGVVALGVAYRARRKSRA
jgi:hypothetical protein